MQTPEEIRADLPPDLDRAESDALVAVAIRLQAASPAPAPGFRDGLRRKLTGPRSRRRQSERSRTRLTPRGARTLAAAYAGSGLALLALAAIGLAGTGPFAPG